MGTRTHARMYKAALFIIGKNGNKPMPIDRKMKNKLQHSHTIIYHERKNSDELQLRGSIWMNLGTKC